MEPRKPDPRTLRLELFQEDGRREADKKARAKANRHRRIRKYKAMIRTCRCGLKISGVADYNIHRRTCPAHQARKEEKWWVAIQFRGKKQQQQ